MEFKKPLLHLYPMRKVLPRGSQVPATGRDIAGLKHLKGLVVTCTSPACDLLSAADAGVYPLDELRLHCRCGRRGVLAQVEVRVRVLGS